MWNYSPRTWGWLRRRVSWPRRMSALVQFARIIADEVARSEFATTDPGAAGQALFDATVRYNHPTHTLEWSNPCIVLLLRAHSLLSNGDMVSAQPQHDRTSRFNS